MSNASPIRGSASPGTSAVETIPCRLCEGTARLAFALSLIGKHQVRFYTCGHCGSLQTELPYWLDEAYSNSNLAVLDTGAAQRNLNNLAAVYAWSRLTGVKTVVDVGGGDGLLCRLLRDYGVDARPEDRYASNTYAQGFEGDLRTAPVLYTGFEVLEHYASPQRDLEMLFGSRPDYVVITTALYRGQASDWWYLTPDSGQHVFFYTRRALEIVAERFGYNIEFIGNYTVFVKGPRLNAFKMALARLAMGNIGVRLLRSLIMLLPARGAIRDFERVDARSMS